MDGHAAGIGEKGLSYKVLVGKCEGRRPPGIPGYRLEDNIKIYLHEIRGEGVI
jgi:hypothetical protein